MKGLEAKGLEFELGCLGMQQNRFGLKVPISSVQFLGFQVMPVSKLVCLACSI
jgi:hypothetical protein